MALESIVDDMAGGTHRPEAVCPWPRRPFIPGDGDPRDMALHEHCVSEQLAWQGRIIRVEDLAARIPTGSVEPRDVVRHPGGVGVVALTPEGTIPVVRQYRIPFDRVTVEIPAGKLDGPEDPLAAAQRELREETGFIARQWEPLAKVAASPGYTDEIVRVYLAQDLTFVGDDPDADEFLNVDMVALAELVPAVLAGKICDAKTVAGILAAHARGLA